MKNTNIIEELTFLYIFLSSNEIRKYKKRFCQIDFFFFFQPSFTYIKVKETNFKTYRKQRQKNSID